MPLFFLFLLLQRYVLAQQQCPDCGNTSVPFPLSTDPSCGQSLYSISCSSTGLHLQAPSGSYPIQSISPKDRKMVISSKPFASSSCITLDALGGGLLLNRSQGFNVTSSNTVMFLNCSSILLRSPLDCSSSSVCHRYIDSIPGAAFCRSNNLCCSFTAGGSSTSYRIRVNTNGTSCSAFVSVVNMDQSLSPSRWSYGIELEWGRPSEDLCTGVEQMCRVKNSSCKLEPKSNTYRCLCNPGFTWDSFTGNCSTVSSLCNGVTCLHSVRHRKRLIAGVASAAMVAAGILVALLLIILRKRSIRQTKRENRARELAQIMSSSGGKTANVFTAKEMKRATNCFSKDRLLGSGGFGVVYKGVLDNGVEVAIKAAKVGNIKGRDQVINEVCILSQVNHRNLVRIWGCCVESEEPLVVYEYVPNGTLFDWLHGKQRFLDWRTRLGVALQTAEGLAYLHSAAYPPIYHRDVKSSNILLDNLMDVRVSDFGLSRLAEPDITHVSTCAQGTLGYLDPEYYRRYQLTDKSDVYSFGVVLLEIVTSQKAIDMSRGPDDANLAMYVLSRSERGEVMQVVDSMLLSSNVDGGILTQSIVAVVMLALNCLRESRGERPTMKEVAEELRCIQADYDDDRY